MLRSILAPFLLVLCVHAGAQSTWAVEALDIRPAGDDFAPVMRDSTLVITSVRERSQAVAYTNAETNKPLADLYEVRLHGQRPGRPRLMDGNLCTPWNDGPASFSPGGDTICITRNIVGKQGKRRSDRLGLFFAVRNQGSWSEAVPFTWNGEEWSVMHGSFSRDGRTLWFASDKPGGQGGTDLYRCERNGDGWGEPENLGPVVNGPGNELFPSMDAAGTLHFSSDRAGGLGKLDLYVTSADDQGFHKPVALPSPVNSTGNDMGWAPAADGITGYFGSDRDGIGRIYRFKQAPVPFQDCAEQKPTRLCYSFEDEGSFNTDTLPLRYEWEFGDGQRQPGLSATHCYEKPGRYQVKLNIIDTLSESVYFNQTSYELEAVADVQAVIGGPDSLATGDTTMLDATASNLPGFTADQVFWDLGDGITGQGLRIDHSWAAAGTYRMRMDLVGGPDGRGGFLHHCVFRDVQVIDGFIASGPPMAKDASHDDGYTFTYTALPNDYAEATLQDLGKDQFSVQLFTSPDRVSLDDARFMPFRKSYTVLERFLMKEKLYTYSIASESTPLALYGAYSYAKQHGFPRSVVQRTPKEKPLAVEQVGRLSLSELDNGVIRVSRVLYRTGEKDFDDAFRKDLERVLDVLRKYPQVELVIEAHTDNVGSAASNQALSEGRAKGVAAWFTQAGIEQARLLPIGFGETRPVGDNSTAEGRAANRRVDFRLNVREPALSAKP
jgi:outer membrane protein OmpA-like peptidoglycan-associated protein